MEGDSCQYVWEMPYIFEYTTHTSPIFPKGNAILTWDMTVARCDDNDRYSVTLRSRSAPFGKIKVNYSIKTYGFDINDDENGFDDFRGTSVRKYSFEFENYENISSNLPIISQNRCEVNDDLAIGTIKIRITATVNRNEQYSVGPKISLPKSLENSYSEEILGAVRAGDEFCDATVSVDGTEFKAHKAILAAVSPVFRAAFKNDIAEKRSNCMKITDFSTEIVRLMVDFIYKGHVKLNHCREALSLLRISDAYGICHLKKFCTSWLKEQMNQDNILEIISTAGTADADDLMEAATSYFGKTPAFFKADDFKDVIKIKPEKLTVFLEKLTAVCVRNKRE